MTASPILDSAWSAPATSDHEAARLLAEAEQIATGRRNAVLAIAGAAHDVADARMLLDILGLGADEIRSAVVQHRVRTVHDSAPGPRTAQLPTKASPSRSGARRKRTAA